MRFPGAQAAHSVREGSYSGSIKTTKRAHEIRQKLNPIKTREPEDAVTFALSFQIPVLSKCRYGTALTELPNVPVRLWGCPKCGPTTSINGSPSWIKMEIKGAAFARQSGLRYEPCYRSWPLP